MIALAAALSVFAASSLRESFTELARAFELKHPGVHVELQFAGSQDLRVQLDNGARADVFASADLEHMRGIGRDLQIFARNEPVLVVPAPNPAGLKQFGDLPKAKRVVLGAPQVPIGEYTEHILAAQDPGFRRQVLAHTVSRELNVRQVLAKVSLGEADAAIVYRTDALAEGKKVQAFEIPGAPLAAYPIAALNDGPLAAEFVKLVLSPEGRAILKAFGFR